MQDEQKLVGKGLNRVDGILKVTGKALYATDYPIDNLTHAVIFKSTIPSGKIRSIYTADAEKAEGVLAVITYKNAPALNNSGGIRGGSYFQNAEIDFYGQHIGVIVAENFEQARHAASLVKVDYQQSTAKIDFHKLKDEAVIPKDKERSPYNRGNVDVVLGKSEFEVEAEYETPIEHHQPLEPHSTIALWEGDKLILYNPSQIINGAQSAAARTFNISPKNVRIISTHIGGGFGSKGGQWGNLIIAAMAAKMVGRPVKLALTRQQMFNSVGLRQSNIQRLRLAASKEGKLLALSHETTTHCAIKDEFIEPCGDCSKLMYEVPNLRISYKVVPLNVIMPTYTRGPGKSTGSFALESAIDELAHKLKIDPIKFRILNEPAKDPSNGKPWSSRTVVQCLTEGAKAFGWDRRSLVPASNQQGDDLIGYGVACGTYPANQRDSSAIIKLQRSKNVISAVVELAAADLGTGSHTIIAQVAADGLGIPLENVEVNIGDSDFPPAAGAVGSVGASSYSNAVNDACTKITDELINKSGKQFLVRPNAADLMVSEKYDSYETRSDSKPLPGSEKYSIHSFNANFAEVRVNKYTGMVRVSRFLAVTGAGNILNPKTSRSQIIGGNVWGIGMALTEESVLDPRWGNFITRSLADYHVPSNLDIGQMDTLFIEEKDPMSNTLGVKGIGEVGIVGVAAAVANAVFNATGKRIRSLPITPDKLI